MRFIEWALRQRGIDTMLIALIVSSAVSLFVNSISESFTEPIITALFGDSTTTLNILGVRTKPVVLLKGLSGCVVTLLIAYIIAIYVFQFKMKKKAKK